MILETGHCVCLEVVSIFPTLALVKKKKTAKGKEAFQGMFVVIVEGCSLVFWENLSNFCQFILVFNCDLR